MISLLKKAASAALAIVALNGCASNRQQPSIESEVIRELRKSAEVTQETQEAKIKQEIENIEGKSHSILYAKEKELLSLTPAPEKKPVTLNSYTISDSDTLNTQLNIYHPNFKGGIGRFFSDKKDINYVSGSTRFSITDNSDITALFHVIDEEERNADRYTLQGALGLGSLSIGGGLIDLPGDNDTTFARTFYKDTTGKLEYLIGGLIKEINGDFHPGVSVAFSIKDNENMAVSAGIQHDELQTRYVGSIILPVLDEAIQLKPGADILYVDNANGSSVTLATLTLGERGKFFDHKMRTGRLLGTTGISYDNPIFGSDPSTTHNLNFNRIPDPWSVTDIATARVLQLQRPDGTTATRFDAFAFPCQFDGDKSFLDNIFVGWSYDNLSGESRSGPLIGLRFTEGSAAGSFHINYFDGEIQGSVSFSITF